MFMKNLKFKWWYRPVSTLGTLGVIMLAYYIASLK